MNNLQIFKNKQFGEIRILEINNKTYFGATDSAKSLGYKNTSAAIITHCKKDGVAIHDTIDSLGRTQKMNFITEGNLYRLISKSQLPGAEKFESWVFDEVLPSIRNNGAYMTENTIEKALTDPDFLIKLAINLKEEKLKRVQAEQKIELDRPKVIFANALEVSNNTILVGELAKLLNQNGIDIGQNRLFDKLRKTNYLCSSGERKNLPTQRSMDLGLFEIKKRTITNADGSVRVTTTTKVTGKGQIYFVNKFKGMN